jgi:hypothetical protein
MMRMLFVPVLLVALAACSGGQTNAPVAERDPDDIGSVLTGRDTAGVTLDDLTGGNNAGTAGLPINALIWRASVDIVSVLPIEDIDAFGCSIITDWYALPSRPDERIKLSVFVLDRELRSDAVRVIVYVQKRQDGLFVDAGIDTELSDRLEELILTRARELRATVENGAE